MNMQFFGEGDWVSTLIWFLMFFVFIMFYPRLMIKQLIWKLETEVEEFEKWDRESRVYVAKRMRKDYNKDIQEAVDHFSEMFAIGPVDLDPAGIIKKLDHIIKNQRDRFREFVEHLSDSKDEEKRKNFEAGLSVAMGMHQVTKVIRHYLEITKKYNNLQFAMLLQMQIPMIKDIMKALRRGVKNMTEGEPVGDSIGPMVAASFMTKKPKELKEDELVYTEENINGKKCVVVKPKGPGARVGDMGKGMIKLIEKYKPERIITIDAAGKLEGEKEGSTAEGVGVAMGGSGVERYYIEEKATKRRIPLDAIAIKMRPENAISAMTEGVFRAFEEARALVKKNVDRAKKGPVLILGVGNTSGIGNHEKSLEEAKKIIQKNIKRMKSEEAEEKKKRSIWDSLSPF